MPSLPTCRATIIVTPSKTAVMGPKSSTWRPQSPTPSRPRRRIFLERGPVITESADHLNVTMQFGPSDSGAHTISLTAQASQQDSRGISTGEATITVTPAAIAGTGSDFWAGGPYPAGST